jgi:hypothetical protein
MTRTLFSGFSCRIRGLLIIALHSWNQNPRVRAAHSPPKVRDFPSWRRDATANWRMA